MSIRVHMVKKNPKNSIMHNTVYWPVLFHETSGPIGQNRAVSPQASSPSGKSPASENLTGNWPECVLLSGTS